MAAYFWLGAFFVLVLFEIATMGLTTIWFAIGSLIAFFAALMGAKLELQLALFVIISFAMLFITRPILKKKMKTKTVRTNVEELIGKSARVTVEIDNLQAKGAAMVNGLEWTARSADQDVKIPAGSIVRICQISGVKLIVEPVKEKDL